MGFYDDPIVDDNSKRSEESVNVVKSLFTRKNGFISREENPDYGVDIDVELILDEKNASSKKFAIQIKSTKTLKIIKNKNEQYISLKFRTSRLGYLVKRAPMYGLIIIYDEIESVCYYDFVEEIIKRLDQKRGGDKWKTKPDVNILIPTNQITLSDLSRIHKKYIKRIENSRLLLQENGNKYDIPYLEFKASYTSEKVNFQDPIQVASFIEKHGSLLFNENEYKMLFQMLGSLSKIQIDSSSELIFISAITHTQIGNIIEAEYYLRKAEKLQNKLLPEQNDSIEFSKIRIDFLKGNIDHKSFLERFKVLAKNKNSIEN